MSSLEHLVLVKIGIYSDNQSTKFAYMWARYTGHKIRLGKSSHVDYNHDLTNATEGVAEYIFRLQPSINLHSPVTAYMFIRSGTQCTTLKG